MYSEIDRDNPLIQAYSVDMPSNNLSSLVDFLMYDSSLM